VDEMNIRHYLIVGFVILFTFVVELAVGIPLALKRQMSLKERLQVVYQVLKEVPLIDG
jgi:hypothetical protein